MIRTLKLTNWRNYEDVTLNFEPGTTFVVASNGVGKTSLVEAARWALFGVTSQVSPVRVGAERAAAHVELLLPSDQVLNVEREMPSRPTRHAIPPAISVDGAPLDENQLVELLREEYGTESSFLSRLTMPVVSDEASPTSLGLEEHLGHYFGVDGLQRAVDHLKAELKSVQRQTSAIKGTNAAGAKLLADLEDAAVSASQAVETTAAEHQRARQRQEELITWQRAHQAREQWNARNGEWLSATSLLLDEVAALLGERLEPAAVEEELERRIAQTGHLAEEARVGIAVRQSRIEAIQTNAARLDLSHAADCPVCRRPLDDNTVSSARALNEADIRELDLEIATLREREGVASAQQSQLRALLQKWRAVPRPGPQPADPDHVPPAPGEFESAGEQVEAALEAFVAARASLADAERRLQEARDADNAMKQLYALFRAEAGLSVALKTTEDTLEELLLQTIRPLAKEVDVRWKALFPNRGELSTHADGSITRNLNGHELPYDAFSTGEGMGATIVLRLLVAQMATTADFCWFDEPLEHLDPDIRRQVASILARASDGAGQLRQVLVTTYEEPLARQLHARSPERVHLLDVRHAPV